MSKGKRAHEHQGRLAESLAALWLMLKGYKIIGRRVRAPMGEIDIVARKAASVHFVEVKFRRHAAQLEDAINAKSLRRVAAAARAIGPHYAKHGQSWQVDAILIAPWRFPYHRHNIWVEGFDS
jgi:putative endonuclease